jgi:hypothetical protein
MLSIRSGGSAAESDADKHAEGALRNERLAGRRGEKVLRRHPGGDQRRGSS